jgi:galactofuranosylgalactofuranosylrhamnosyl-N-acetylglucosaminyl-diphospho-decaprenol beta-1,5/1,6-galactofuranosyltransferase
MRIQNILLPKVGVCTVEPMYFRRENGYEREIQYDLKKRCIYFAKFGCCSFDTYFNCVSVAKWKKYTNIEEFSLVIKVKGKFELKLINLDLSGNAGVIIEEKESSIVERENAAVRINNHSDGISYKIVNDFVIQSDDIKSFAFPYKLYEYHGVITFQLKALEEGATFYGGYYEGKIDHSKLKKTNIAINICTFKREPFVLRNINILKENIINDEKNALSKHLQVYISDNGQTLPIEQLNDEVIHIVPNKNVGGAGGFTRGLIEIMNHQNQFQATHALMMDDDVIIEPEALYRTYAFLSCRKDEFEDLFVGGAMLKLDEQNMQVESGASWNAGALISNKTNFNLARLKHCLINEIEEYTEYNAWWYCCTPMHVVNDQNLPLPIFIRGDDLEYGLRNMKTLVLLNGICVWHEAFENKYSSFLQYYILRNLLYDNAIHFGNFGTFALLKKMYAAVARELVYYRYKNIDLIFEGIDDFLKGVEFLKETDGEKLHQSIMAKGYKAQPIDKLTGAVYHISAFKASCTEGESRISRLIRFISLNGYLLPAHKKTLKVVPMAQCRPINFYRASKVLNYDPTSCKGFITKRNYAKLFNILCKLGVMTIKTILNFSSAKKKFRDNYTDITNRKFWEKYLNIR